MLLGRSVFHSVIDRLRAEEAADAPEDDGQAPGPSHRVHGLNMSFAAADAESETGRLARLEHAYREILEDGTDESRNPEPPDDERMPPHLTILDPVTIAAELGIGPTTSPAQLHDLRRTFARVNHPDRVPAAFRDNATIRMTVANQLIDAALHQHRRQ